MPSIDLDSYQAIQELKSRYCRFMDTKQWQQWSELFTDDVVMDVSDDVSPDIGNPITTGREAVVSQVQGFVGNAITVHQVHAPEIQLTSDDTASGIWAMSDVVIWPEDVASPVENVSSIHGYGHYHEQYRRENGQWKIASLKLTRLHLDFK